MEITLLLGIAIALCGVGVGILSAMFGIGGGMVMVPLIHIVFGQPAAIASGTSLFAILPTSISGMLARLHDGTIRFRIGIIVGIAGACLSPLGAVAATNLPGMYAMILTGVFILFTAYKMFKRVYKSRPAALAGAANGATAPAPKKTLLSEDGSVRFYVGCILLGCVVGFLSGWLGLGGGFLIVPILQAAFGLTMKQASGTSLVSVGILAVPSFITHALLGNIDWLLGLLLIVGSIIGAKLGAKILTHVNERLLTGLFGVLLVLSGIIMVVREIVG
ncbi:MAG: sulfite exporter TauE/SafE family protein [Coriobacteriia bacterium]|nr:sulfite exporter TauE/SafE family protein [Coriobacteriia bacterium]MBS5477905.1 sulfite exporter TauE/SafE family protein [Coriobacteriia bacterium]